MKYLVTSGEMKKYDTYTINEIGISSDVLMERAALFSVDLILDYFRDRQKGPECFKVLVVCGQGNNGGDGLAVARLLHDRGCKVRVCFAGNKDKASPEVIKQCGILEKYGMALSADFPEDEYDVIVDALFGIGLSREITGEYAVLIEKLNLMKGLKVALDIPSGVDATTGKIWGTAFKADITATFAYGKRGLYFYPGAEYAGEIHVGEIGITELSFNGNAPGMYIYDEEAATILPKRNPAGNKGTFGKVLTIAGSEGMAGAAILCTKAAFRAGAGMVKLVTAKENQMLVQKTLPEVMFLGMESACEEQGKLDAALDWADCILAGPGLGTSKDAEFLLSSVISHVVKGALQKPLILDADALNLISGNEGLQKLLTESVCEKKSSIVMTPHVGELARLLNCSTAHIKEDFVKAARTAAEKYKCIMVCKDARTLVCEAEGSIYLNVHGNSGMATAGSGDVLSGIIAAFYAAKDDGMMQATLGVFLHAKSGDYAAMQKGEAALMATDIIEVLPMIQKGN